MGLLRNRSFVLVFLGMTVSLLGDAFYALALPIWVLNATGSAGAVAFLLGLSSITTLLLSPLAGTVADRTDRRHIMIAADLVRAGTVTAAAIFMFSGRAEFGHVLIAAAFLSATSVFFTPAYAAAQSGLVHPDDLTRSLSLFQMMRQVVALAGPSIAGVMVARVGTASALGVDAGTFLLSAGCLTLMRLRWAPRPSRERRPFWVDFRAGFTVIASHPILSRTVLLTCGVNAAGAMFGVILPVIALREWHLTAQQFGLWGTASPAGIMLGLALVTAAAKRIQARGRFMLVSLLAMGLVNMAMGWSSGFWGFTVLLFLGGFTFGTSNVMFAALYRVLVPPEQQGRFFGFLGSINQALQPLGAALAGVLSDRVSPFAGAAVAGSVVMILAFWGLSRPGLRDVA